MDLDEARQRYPLPSVLAAYTDAPIEPGRKIRCPFPWHDDSTPSFHIGRDWRWRCYGCGLPAGNRYGDIFDFLGYIQYGLSYDPGQHLREILDSLGELRLQPAVWAKPEPDRNIRPVIEEAQVERWADALRARELEYWRKQGLTPNTLFRFRVGFDGERYTIPYTYRGLVTAVKKRRDDDIAPHAEPKYIMHYGSRMVAPFNIDAVIMGQPPPRLLIVEDEKSVLVAHQYGLTAISCPAGSWKPAWNKLLWHVENIIVIADWDDPGLRHAEALQQHMRRVRIVQAGGFFPDGRRATDLHDMAMAIPHDQRDWLARFLGIG